MDLMLPYIWLFFAMHINSFILQDTYNIILKDSADFKIDQIIYENDYEMINEEQTNTFKIEDKDEKFSELNKLASEQYKKALKIIRNDIDGFKVKGAGAKSNLVKEIDYNIIASKLIPVTIHPITKINADNSNKEYYNYGELLDEYYIETKQDAKSNLTYNSSKTEVNEFGFIHSIKNLLSFHKKKRNCSEELNQIGIKAIQCLVNEYRTQRTSSKILTKRLFNIIKIWFLVYLAVAVPSWCTRGWCCCCLFCKCFKPQLTIDEAKRYLMLHPPGVLKTMKGGVIQYEPTQREKETYEELEHFIRTL